jgi:hypothetical protein
METTNRKRANRIASGVIATILLSIALIVTFPLIFMSTLLITGALCGLYFLFKIIRNTVQDHLDEAELNRRYMNNAYKEAKDKMGKKPKIAP